MNEEQRKRLIDDLRHLENRLIIMAATILVMIIGVIALIIIDFTN